MSEEFNKKLEELKLLITDEKDIKIAKLALQIPEKKAQESRLKTMLPTLSPFILAAITAAVSIISIVIGRGYDQAQMTEQVKLQTNLQQSKYEAEMIANVIKDSSEERIIKRLFFLAQTGIITDKNMIKEVNNIVSSYNKASKVIDTCDCSDSGRIARRIPKTSSTLSIVINKNSDAQKYEDAGFQAIINRNIDYAKKMFDSAEQSYSGYHSVYEIWAYLKKWQDNHKNKPPTEAEWSDIRKDIYSKYSWGMPDKYKEAFRPGK